MEHQHRHQPPQSKTNQQQKKQISPKEFERRLNAYKRISAEIKANSTPPAQHGVTISAVNAKVIGQDSPPTVPVKADTEVLIIRTEGTSYITDVTITSVVDDVVHKNVYRVALPKDTVKITPNSLENVDEATRKKIYVDTNKVVLQKIDYKSNLSGAGFLHIPGIPQAFKPVFHNFTSSVIDFGASNNTFSIKVNFGNIPESIKLSESERTKYQGKTFVFRFTALQHNDFEKTILIEELGEFKDATLNKEDEVKLQTLLQNYQLALHTPTTQEVDNAKQLKQAVGASTDRIFAKGSATESLYHQAFLPFASEEEAAIKQALLKMTPEMLQRIAGVTFHKRPFVYIGVENQRNKVQFDKGWVAAQYHPDAHTISLYEGATKTDAKIVFGDKGAASFTGKQEQAIIHELGHAVDLSEYTKASIKQKELEAQLANAPDSQKAGIQKQLDAHNDAFKKIKSLTGRAYSGNANSRLNYLTEFDKASKQDLDRISKYAKTNDIENFADAFSLYITEPATLKSLSPNVYNYFNKHFPQ